MVRTDSGTLKTARLQHIRKQMALNLKDVVQTDRLLDWIELNIGLTRNKAKQYVDLIVRSEGWIESNGRIAFTIDDLEHIRRE